MEESKNLEQSSDKSNEKLHISDVKNSVEKLYDKYDREMKDYFLEEIGKGSLTREGAYKKRVASIKAGVLKEVLEYCF